MPIIVYFVVSLVYPPLDMNALIRFLLRFKTLFFFIILELLSLFMIVKYNSFQRIHFFSSSNMVVGKVHSFANGISDYFTLGSVNEALAEENAMLKRDIAQLQSQVQFYQSDTSYAGRKAFAEKSHYDFITAKIVYGTTHLEHNYLTIDKGLSDGVEDGMGVINERGVIGIVSNVSSHFSTVMPILNPFCYINAKVPGKSNVGTIIWHGGDERFAKLEEIPLYIPIEKGDTVLSSTYSSIFPEGIMIGTIAGMDSLNNNFYSIDVSLSVDFSNLKYVDVIQFHHANELTDLKEKEVTE